MNRLLDLIHLLILLFALIQGVNAQTELVIRQGHKMAINQVLYAQDGSALFSASDDMSIKMWDVNTGIDIKTFNGHTAGVTAIRLSNDGQQLISGDRSGKLFIWDINDPSAPIISIDGHSDAVNTIELTRDFKSFYTGSSDNLIKKWELSSGKEQQTINVMTSAVRAIGLSPDGTRAIVGGQKANDLELLLLDMDNGTILDDAIKHYKARGLAKAWTYAVLGGFSIATNVAKGNVGKDMLDFYIMNFNNIEYANDGKSVLISQNTFLPMTAAKGEEEKSGATAITIADITDDGNGFKDVKKVKRWTIPYPNTRAVFNKDQTKIIANLQNAIKIYDVANAEFPEPKEAAGYEPPVLQEFKGDVNWLNSVALSPDYRTMASSDDDRRIKLWDVETGRIIRTLEGYVQPALAVELLPDGKHVLVGSLDRDMTMWDITTGALVRTFDRASDVSHIDVSADGKYVLTTSVNTRFFKIWNLGNGRQLKSFLEKSENVVWVKFHEENDDLLFAQTEKGNLKIWSKEKNKIVKNLNGQDKSDFEDKYDKGPYSVSMDAYSFEVSKNGSKAFGGTQRGIISDAVFSHDSRYLVTTNESGEIALYDLASGELKASMALINNNDFITYTPDFYYTSSKVASRAIAFKSGNTVLPFEQFELKYNRPDIVAERLGYASEKLVASYKAAYDRRLKRLGFKEEDLSGSLELPVVEINASELPLLVQEREFQIKVTASDPVSKLDRLLVYINDVPLYGTKGIDLSDLSTSEITKDLGFQLGAGMNQIEVVAVNANGTRSIPATFDVNYEAGFFKPTLYLAAIGISEYQEADYNLAFAAKDAQDLVSTLQRSPHYGQVETKVLINEQGTADNIRALRDFVMQANIDDVVVIFIAGHGVLDDSYSYYFATHDMDFNNPANGGLPYAQIEDLLSGIMCQNKLLMMDTCHSGELDSDDVETVGEVVQSSGAVAFRSTGKLIQMKQNSFGLENTLELSKALFGDLKKGTGATIISAAGGAEFALEGLNSQNGLFTSTLIQGIRTRRADLNRNRAYSVSEIQQYVSEQVIKMSKGKQVPTSRSENIKNDFSVY